MMTDIVKRLLAVEAGVANIALHREAAAEIGRLRAALAEIQRRSEYRMILVHEEIANICRNALHEEKAAPSKSLKNFEPSR